MREFQEKRKFKNNLFGWLQIFLGVVLSALVFFHCESVQKSQISAKRSGEIKEEMAKLEKETQNWRRRRRGWKANQAKKGRLEKGLMWPNRAKKILVIVDKNSEDVKINGEDIQSRFFFYRLWRWIERLF